jgi:hypothetical protein
VTPHQLFARITPTKRILAIEYDQKGIISAAISDEYLGASSVYNSTSIDFERVVLDLDVGGLLLVQRNNDSLPSNFSFDAEKKAERLTVSGITWCRWPHVNTVDQSSGIVRKRI